MAIFNFNVFRKFYLVGIFNLFRICFRQKLASFGNLFQKIRLFNLAIIDDSNCLVGVEIPEESTTNNLQPTTMKKLIVFNWKSNPHNAASAIKLAQLVEKSIPKKNAPEVVIAPPFFFLKVVGKFIKSQLSKDLKGLSIVKGQMSNVIVAYEPIWAIGAGHSDTPQDAVEMIKYIKEFSISNFQFSNIKVLYGGSVDGKNIKNFIQYKEIDGFLVGNASLKQKEFDRIIKA